MSRQNNEGRQQGGRRVFPFLSLRKAALLIGAATVIFAGAGAMALAQGNHLRRAAHQSQARRGGTQTTSYNWTLTPAGKQVTLGDFPMGGAMSPDHQYLIVTNDGQGEQSLQVIRTSDSQVVQTVSYKAPEALYLGIAFSPDGKTVYASAGGNNKIRTYSFQEGRLTEQAPIQMSGKNYYPGGLVLSPDGKSLYVANNMDGSVSKVDLQAKQVSDTVATGHNPYTAILNRDGSKLYVSNWGENSVSVIDTRTFKVIHKVEVGLHPNAMAVNPRNGEIYVSNSDSDTVSVIAPATDQVVRTLSLQPYRSALTGSQPDALAVSPDGSTLYVANAGNNDVAVIAVTHQGPKTVRGLLPTAWYPTGVFLTGDGKGLFVLNAKGLGAGPNPGYQQGKYGPPNEYIGSMIKGTLSTIPVPSQAQLSSYTRQVQQNDHFKGGETEKEHENASPIPRYTGQKSPIKHVIYVIKENRTYDQVFGDMGKGNGDPALTEFGYKVTPNIHRLANQFTLLDNFYADAEISAQGHNWSTAAKSNDYTEKNWMADYSGRNRGYDFEGTNPATYPQKGFMWDAANRSHVSYRDYGEFAHYDSNTKTWQPSDPTIGSNIDPHYPGWNLNISDLTRYDEWKREFDQYQHNGKLPALEILRLPNDHTAGTKPGMLTPSAMVAQNDYALGKLVDSVSHSRYWKDTAIFVVEDDAQDGPDHVDAHRTEALVISPYTQKGSIDSTRYDTASMVKTMELILGLKPMTQYDAAATPMLNSFISKPNTRSYKVVKPQQSISTQNQANAPMAAQSAAMDFSVEDRAPEQQLNEAIWKSVKGTGSQMPAPKTDFREPNSKAGDSDG